MCRKEVCFCVACRDLRFDDCEMKDLFGTVKRVEVPRDSNAGLQQLDNLQKFAEQLRANWLVAMANSEQHLEGPYWLALVLCRAFVATRDTVHTGDQFEVGWVVVKVQWYKYEEENNTDLTRAYRLMPGERIIPVNVLLRLVGLRFPDGPGGPQQRTLRSGSTACKHLGSDTHNVIMNCISEQNAQSR